MSQPPIPFQAHDSGAYLHGTKARLTAGDLLRPGFESNYEKDRISNYIYFAKTLDAAAWGADLAVEDDPNVTDKKFPGNPTMSYRSAEPVRVLGELADWLGHAPEQIAAMRSGLAELRRTGKAQIED